MLLLPLLVLLAAAPARGGAVALEQSAAPAKPRVVWRPIPFPPVRRAETAAYGLAHYGRAQWRLSRPRVIVEHYTANTSFRATWNTFASDDPDPELGQRPGTCAHFVVDTDGTIYQLVPLRVRCRHTVGLNWTAIGIEHVGSSARSVLADGRQLRASLALTLWLMHRYGIALGDVIGHAESTSSPYHRERYAPWRCQTHGDWTRAEMDRYRALLARRAAAAAVPLGKLRDRVDHGC